MRYIYQLAGRRRIAADAQTPSDRDCHRTSELHRYCLMLICRGWFIFAWEGAEVRSSALPPGDATGRPFDPSVDKGTLVSQIT